MAAEDTEQPKVPNVASIVITGVDALDGEYPFDFDRRMTARELYFYREVAKHGWDERGQAIDDGSGALVVLGITVLALVRAGKILKAQALAVGEMLLDLGEDDTVDASIRYVAPGAVVAARPPDGEPEPSGATETPTGEDETSSTDSERPSETTLEPTPTPS